MSQGRYASLNLGPAVGDEPAAVAENQRRFAAAVGYPAEKLFEISQVHGNIVRVVDASDSAARVREAPADGLAARGGAAIGVRTADCVPILVADPASRSVAALHAGWRGCVAGIVPAGIQALRTLADAEPGRLVAALFPHIRACCFEVGEDVAASLAAVASGAESALLPAERPTAATAAGTDSPQTRVERPARPAASCGPAGVVEWRGEKPHVSLARVVILQLMAAGLPAANLEVVDGCTRCDAARFYSFRRDGRSSGRHVTAIVSG